MATDVIMPVLGLTMEEGKVVRWLKKEGDDVTKGEPLAEIEGDKAVLEIEAPAGGVLKRILVQEGVTVPVTELIAIIAQPGEDLVEAEPAGGASEAVGSAGEQPSGKPAPLDRQEDQEEGAAGEEGSRPKRVKASPRARSLAAQYGVTNAVLGTLIGTGPEGRVIERDVLEYVEKLKEQRASALARGTSRPAEEGGAPAGPAFSEAEAPGGAPAISPVGPPAAPVSMPGQSFALTVASSQGGPSSKAVPLSPIRRVIAERMTTSVQTIPQFTIAMDVDASEMIRFRDAAGQVGGPGTAGVAAPKPSHTSLLVKAVAKALTEFPAVNASLEGENVIYKERVDVGVAVAVEDGLVVPVVRDAARKGILEISAEMEDLGARARARKLKLEEMKDSTFTVSNLGMFGVDWFRAIVNPPEAAILAVGRIASKVVVGPSGQPTVRPVMTVTLSCDHRVLDGAVGARFLSRVRQLLEMPQLILL